MLSSLSKLGPGRHSAGWAYLDRQEGTVLMDKLLTPRFAPVGNNDFCDRQFLLMIVSYINNCFILIIIKILLRIEVFLLMVLTPIPRIILFIIIIIIPIVIDIIVIFIISAVTA